MKQIQINKERCVGCRLCLHSCPVKAISMVGGKAEIDEELCTLCGACIPACHKYQAIDFHRKLRHPVQTGKGAIWVLAELESDGSLASVSRELLGAGRKLAQPLRVAVEAVILGHRLEAAIEDSIAHGADRVIAVDHPRLAEFMDQPYAAILTRLIKENQPEIVLGGATAAGRALLPRVAVFLGTGLTADCTRLEIDPQSGLLLQTRPAFGGNLLATITCAKARPQMATVRPGVMSCAAAVPGAKAPVVRFTPRPEELASDVRQIDWRPQPRTNLGLRQAEVIVSAGYGVGGQPGVEKAAALARILGGCLGATRSVVDAGWADYVHQIGQTGTTVQPRLYIACGISGAIQHIVGMQNSERIIAINKDAEAPIFNYADTAIVGDVNDILTECLHQLDTS